MPFAYFFSIFYIINNYEEKNQLLIYWTHGIKKREFLNTIVKFSFLFLILQFLLSVLIVPYSLDKARSFIRTSSLDFFPSLIKPKRFIDTVENLTIFIESKDKNGLIRNVLLKEKIDKDSEQIILSKTGEIFFDDNGKYLILYNGKIINTGNKKESSVFNFKETKFDLNKFTTKTTTYPKIQELKTSQLFNCAQILLSKNQIIQKVKARNFYQMNCEKSFLENIIQELFKRIYLPIYIPLIALIASILILRSKNSYKYSIFKVYIFTGGVFFLILSEISLKFAGINSLYNILFLIIPIFSFLMIYTIFTNKLNLDK